MSWQTSLHLRVPEYKIRICTLRRKQVFRPKRQWKTVLKMQEKNHSITRVCSYLAPTGLAWSPSISWMMTLFSDFWASQLEAASGGEVHTGRKRPQWCWLFIPFDVSKKSKAFSQTSQNSSRTKKTNDKLNVESRHNQEERCIKLSWVRIKSTPLKSVNSY